MKDEFDWVWDLIELLAKDGDTIGNYRASYIKALYNDGLTPEQAYKDLMSEIKTKK